MDFMSHRVSICDLKIGDHVYTWRTPFFIYSHHGIYVGAGKVVHFTQVSSMSSASEYKGCCSEDGSGVIKSCLDCFLRNGKLYRFQYGVRHRTFVAKIRRGICTTAQSDPPEAVIDKAMCLLDKGFGEYNVINNNCEDFALYCKTGLLNADIAVGESGQVNSVIGLVFAAAVSLPLSLVPSRIRIGVVAGATYAFCTYANDIGVRNDLVPVPVEGLAEFRQTIQ